uniref:Glycosyltransferase n=1 Tax=Oryza punctata TaxID=4537 RepID=A0A0E0KP15_ORYPU
MGSPAPAPATRRQHHAVMVPYPAQGHVTPMLKLAKLLHARGFHVTFVNTEFNHRRLLPSRGAAALDGLPGFRFATIPDGLPRSDADATQDIPSLCYSTMTTCLPHLSALLDRINAAAVAAAEGAPPPVTCVVCDGVMSFAYDAARRIGVPCAALWTASACGFMGYRHYRQLVERGLVPLRDVAQLTDGYLDTVVDGARGMCDGVQLRDFPSFIRTTDRGDTMLNFLIRESERLSLPDAVIVNTFDDLERQVLDEMRKILPPVYTVGPLLLQVRRVIPAGSPLDVAIGSNLWKEQDGLLEWLDGRPPRSVVYVNYGSIAVMTNEQMLEFAWGLADSGYPFLWNVRPDLVKGDAAVLPPEFLVAVDGRGLLTTWCPQEQVIEHAAVGVFLTHSGWNSTLESLVAGVPMLSWPFFAEQQTNCRYKRTEWGVGMEIGGEARRGEVAALIREAMEGEKGREMRRRVAEWKEMAARASLPGGPAECGLDRLIDEVLLGGGNKGDQAS